MADTTQSGSSKLAELLPCPNPWCEQSEPQVWGCQGMRLFVGCEGCGMEGPEKQTEAEAITAWNTRQPPQGQDELREALEDWWKPDPEDPFWMLEVQQGRDNAGSWLKNKHSVLTTRDPAKALRYPSWWAAECERKRLYPKDHEFKPTEHLWAALSTTPKEEGS